MTAIDYPYLGRGPACAGFAERAERKKEVAANKKARRKRQRERRKAKKERQEQWEGVQSWR